MKIDGCDIINLIISHKETNLHCIPQSQYYSVNKIDFKSSHFKSKQGLGIHHKDSEPHTFLKPYGLNFVHCGIYNTD